MFDTRPAEIDIRRHSGLRRWLAVAFGTTLLALYASSVVAATSTNDPAPAARTTWTTLAPKGEGFSIEVPGQPEPASKPGKYVYAADEWAFFVKVDSVTDTVREFVVAEEHGPIRQYLDTIRKGLAKGATERSSSRADFEGYPSLRFSAEGQTDGAQPFEGKYWLLVTDEHFYLLMALGPKGTSNTNADRFLGSFHLVKPRAASAGRKTPAVTSPTAPLAEKLSAPMLAVALLITEERLNTKIDQIVTGRATGEAPRTSMERDEPGVAESAHVCSPAESHKSPRRTKRPAKWAGTSRPLWRVSRRAHRPTRSWRRSMDRPARRSCANMP